ncbi:hypothetical protein WCLP8_730003 [uncultured Gammaproteobacteria bacterium]
MGTLPASLLWAIIPTGLAAPVAWLLNLFNNQLVEAGHRI